MDSYKELIQYMHEEVQHLNRVLQKHGHLSMEDRKKLYYSSKTAVKLAKMEDIMMHLWQTGRVSGHPHEDGHYEYEEDLRQTQHKHHMGHDHPEHTHHAHGAHHASKI